MMMVLYLSSNHDILLIFLLFITKEIKQHILNVGLDLLLELLGSTNLKQQQDASVALYKVYLGEQYVNSSTLSDLTFLVEGKCFYAHRIALLASSDAFCAMFDGVYRCSYRYLPIDNFNLKCLSGCPRYQSKDHVGLGS
uniref:BTB domain-containing protein n=1 Tax=Musa acuminata subsp. malaccensis TaxID=214687 RepID=A0A804KR74_MUSAM